MNGTSNDASALALYARHPLILDALWEAPDLAGSFDKYASEAALPRELRDFVMGNASFLTTVLAKMDEQVRAFEAGVLEALSERFDAKFARIPTRAKPWKAKLALSLKSTRRKKEVLALGWYWDTWDKKSWIVPWIWLIGSRRAEALIIRAHREAGGRPGDARPGKEVKDADWFSGDVRLSPIEVTCRVKNFALDLDALGVEILSKFAWLPEDAAVNLIKQVLTR